MNLLTRLTLVVVLTCAGFGTLLWLANASFEREVDSLVVDLSRERAQRFEFAVDLQGRGLESMTSSYAWWNDMVQFMGKPDPKWATDNIDNIVGIPNGGDGLWVLDPQLNLVHTIDKNYRKHPLPATSPAALKEYIGANYTFRYFARIDGQLWEIFGAAIQDANFWRHETPVRGYLLIGKAWDPTLLAELNTLVGARLAVRPPKALATGANYSKIITGLDRKPLALIEAQFDFDVIQKAQSTHERHLLLVSLGAIIALGLVVAYVGFIVLRPLSQVIRSLESRLPTPINDLLTSRSEFGEIARLLAGQLRWGQLLQEEMRRHLEKTDPARLQHEAESNEALRIRLAGNLHDGPIQAIYAAGLQLKLLQSEKESGVALPPERIEQIITTLNHASSDLRAILFDLESEELRDRSLETALRRFEEHMEQVGRCQLTLEITPTALDGLNRHAETQLYYVCRELVSNSLRHATPVHASLRFSAAAGFLCIEWRNDGVPPNPRTEPGNGLRSIERRIRDLGGVVTSRPFRKNEWQAVIEVPYTSLTTSATATTPPMEIR